MWFIYLGYLVLVMLMASFLSTHILVTLGLVVLGTFAIVAINILREITKETTDGNNQQRTKHYHPEDRY